MTAYMILGLTLLVIGLGIASVGVIRGVQSEKELDVLATAIVIVGGVIGAAGIYFVGSA